MLGVILIIALPYIGWQLFTLIFDSFVNKPSKDVFIAHNHYDNRQVHYHTTQQEDTPPELH